MSAHSTHDGLRFSCQRCSACCRHDPGYVFISQNDIDILAKSCGMSYNNFMKIYCRWIRMDDGIEKLSLKEKANYDCILWNEGTCSVYACRPAQCRAYPFWPTILESEAAWSAEELGCPGIDQGESHSASEIESVLRLVAANPAICRDYKERSPWQQ